LRQQSSLASLRSSHLLSLQIDAKHFVSNWGEATPTPNQVCASWSREKQLIASSSAGAHSTFPQRAPLWILFRSDHMTMMRPACNQCTHRASTPCAVPVTPPSVPAPPSISTRATRLWATGMRMVACCCLSVPYSCFYNSDGDFLIGEAARCLPKVHS
jgi:hypothetical protein